MAQIVGVRSPKSVNIRVNMAKTVGIVKVGQITPHERVQNPMVEQIVGTPKSVNIFALQNIAEITDIEEVGQSSCRTVPQNRSSNLPTFPWRLVWSNL